MKRKILSLVIVISVLMSIYIPSIANAESFLSEEMAEKYIELFYKSNDEKASTVKDILTGKKKGTADEIKEIYTCAVSVLGIVNQTDLFSEATEDIISDMTRVTEVVSGVIDIVTNIKTFSESENDAQKIIDGIQGIDGLLQIIGKSDLIPIQLKVALNTVEAGLAVGGFLEKAYLLQGLQRYEVDLALAYFCGSELPYVTPTIIIGSGITQEEADALYAAKYMEYKMMEIVPEGFYEADGSETNETGIAGNIIDRNTDIKKTTYIDDNLTINSILNLKDEILIVKNDVIQNSGAVNLNNGVLIVQGNYRQKDGNLNVENGYIEINGNYTNNANLIMNSSKGYMLVRGDMTVSANLGYGGRDNITAGVLELKGDFAQYGDRNGIWYTEDANHSLLGFCASGSHKTILSGTDSQTIYMQGRVHEGFNEYPNCSKFNVLESINPKASLNGGVSANTITKNSVFTDFKVSHVILNDTEINVKGNANIGSSLVLNNSKVAIAGDLNNSGGISMSHSTDYIVVEGDYTQYYENKSKFTNGVLEIKGNMVDCGGYQPTNQHKTILSGGGSQNIDLHYYKSYGQVNYYGKFNSLEILNTSVEGITISETPAKVYGELSSLPETVIINPLEIYLCDEATISGIWHYGLTLNNWIAEDSLEICGNVNIVGKTIFHLPQTVHGDVYVTGTATLINKNKLLIDGSMSVDNGTLSVASIKMKDPESYIFIKGDYIHKVINNSEFTDGTFEIKGDMIDCGGYQTKGNHKTILSGESKQSIDMHYSNYWGDHFYGNFNILKIANTSCGGIEINDSNVNSITSISQPTGTLIVNSNKMFLQGKTAFIDYGELNQEINRYVGNAENVIPTWLDYERYIYKDYLKNISIGDAYINNNQKYVSIAAVSDVISDMNEYDMLFMTDGKEVRAVPISELFNTIFSGGDIEIGILFKNIPYENANNFKARFGNSSEMGEKTNEEIY